MDPFSLGVLALIAVSIIVILVVIWTVRAWIRTMKLMFKLVFYGGLALLLLLLAGAGAGWFVYGDQVRAALGG